MRLAQVFEESLQKLAKRVKNGQIVIVVTVDKVSALPPFMQAQFKYRVNIPVLGKEDRIEILQYLIQKISIHLRKRLDMPQLQKYFQAKTFKEIQNLIRKIFRRNHDLESLDLVQEIQKIEK